MRKTPLIAAALLAWSAASAQNYGAECRGDTISELARCAAERAPAPEASTQDVEEAAPLNPRRVQPSNPRRVQPSNLGGALQPSNLRREPPVVGRSNQQALTADRLTPEAGSFDPLRGLGNDPDSPLYGLGRTNAERQRILDPLSGTGIGVDR